MHLSECLHPKTIRNPFTHELMVVPCNKCSACLNHKSYEMVQRLNIEGYQHKYQVFFTLTYDNDHLPKLHVLENCLYEVDKNRVAPGRPRISFNLLDIEHTDRDIKFLRKMESVGVPYLSRYDAQCFMKRLRINNYRNFIKHNKNEEESLLRFYLCGELGPRNYRPHYHGILFFNSDFTAAHIESLIRKSWSFGFVDVSFVKNSCSNYVAQYVTCNSHLPAFYRHREIRPFCLYSTCPPIGALYYDDERIQELFRRCSPVVSLPDAKRRQIIDVPHWRFIEDRFFPRCPLFSEITHFDRIALYRVATNWPFTSASEFVDWSKESGNKSDSLQRLLDNIMNRNHCDCLESSLYRLYYISQLVWSNSIMFGVDISTYVEHIERYYSNKDYCKLKKQFAYEVDYVENGGRATDLIWLDKFWIESQMLPDDYTFRADSVSDSLRSQLESFGIDVSLFFSVDLTKRKEYYESLSLSLTKDFEEFKINSDKIHKDSIKTKKKNDYLSSDGNCLSDLY